MGQNPVCFVIFLRAESLNRVRKAGKRYVKDRKMYAKDCLDVQKPPFRRSISTIWVCSFSTICIPKSATFIYEKWHFQYIKVALLYTKNGTFWYTDGGL